MKICTGNLLKVLALLAVFITTSTGSYAAYDQVFDTIKLRQGYSYFFGDRFNAGSRDAGLSNLTTTFTEGANYNRAGNPSFPWTTSLVNDNYIVPANTSALMTWSTPAYAIIDRPLVRRHDNLEIVYDVEYYENVSGTWQLQPRHTEYQPYTITWCGDGVRDDYVDQYNGNRVRETCDPNDSNNVGWGNGGCSHTCQPITIPEPPVCNSVSVSPMTGNAPLNTNIACSGTNNSTYKIQVLDGASVIRTFNSRTAAYTFANDGDYTVKCFVDETITSPACSKPVKVHPTPPTPTCDGLTVSPQAGNPGLTSSFSCSGTAASSYQVEITRNGNSVRTFTSPTGSYTFNTVGNYQVECRVNGTITNNACRKPVTITEPDLDYDLALKKRLVGDKTVFKQGDEVVFDIIVVNQGEVAANNVEVTDYIPAGLTLMGTYWSQSGNTAIQNIGYVAANTSKTVQIRFLVSGTTLGAIRNFAEISADDGDDCDSTPDAVNGNQSGETDATGMIDNDTGNGCNPGGDEDDHDYADITVVDMPHDVYDLALIKTLAVSGPFVRGGDVTFNITVSNQGNVDSGNIEVTDYIPTGLTLNDANWALSGSIATRNISNITAGQAVVLPISFTINSDAPDSITNLAEISEDDGDDCDSTPNAGPTNDGTAIDNETGTACEPGGDEDDHDPETIPVGDGVGIYDLALIKTLASAGPFVRGGEVIFNIRVTNQGNVDAHYVQVTDYIPNGLTLNDVNWSQSGSNAVRTLNGLTAGSSVTLPIRFAINTDAPDSITNIAEISNDDGDDCDSTPNAGPTNDGTPIDNEDGTACEPGGDEDDHDPETITIGSGNVYDLALRKILGSTGPFTRGQNVTFRITVFNQGNVNSGDVVVTDYIPTGLTLNDANWTQSGSVATRALSSITPGGDETVTISFTINTDAPESITNIAEISSDSGVDCDSTPDANSTNDGTPINNEIGTTCEPGGDEDDHDPETITLEDAGNVCLNLTASPSTGRNSLTSTLTCTGNNATTFRIEVRDSAGNIVNTLNTPNGSVTLGSVGTYTASCFVNGATTTANSCTQTLTVTPPTSSSSGGGGTVSCSDIIRDDSDTYTCYGNNRTRSIALQCGVDVDGNPIFRTPVFGANITREVSGRRTATFNCSDPFPKCYVKSTEDTTISSSDIGSWTTSAACEIQTNPVCGDGIVQPERGEQCDLGAQNGSSSCSSTCRISSSSSGGGSSSSGGGSSSSGGGSSSSGGGTTDCSDNNSCVLTFPNGGELLFGPVGSNIIGHGANPLDKAGTPYLVNNSDYDLSFDQFCIKRTSSDTNGGGYALESVHTNAERCINIGNEMIYAYERIEFDDYGVYPNYTGNKAGVSGANYGDAILTTSLKDDIDGNGVIDELYEAYFAADLNVRVAKPAVVSVGGGTSYVKDSSTTSDIYEVTKGVSGVDAEENKNFVGASASDSGISSFGDSVTDVSAIDDIEAENTDYKNVVDSVTDTTTVVGSTTGYSDFENYNGLANVFILKGQNVTLDSIPTLTNPTTYIIEGGNLNITGDMLTNENVAFVVKGGSIMIDGSVLTMDGTYIAIPGASSGGSISSTPSADQLTVNGSLYGDLTNLVGNRYYISEDNGQLSVGTVVSFGSRIFTKPAPLVSQFIGEYLESDKVAR